MLKALEEISPTKKRIKIEIPADTIEKEISESLENLRRTSTIPGFRTGKAPMSLIEKRFGKKVEDDVLEKIIPKAYVAVLNEADLTPVADPVVEEKTEFKRHSPFSLTLLIEVLPRVELDYEGIKVKDIPVTVTDEDVENVLKGLQEERTAYEPSDEPVDMNDLILCDYSIMDSGIEKKDQVYRVGGSLFPEDVVKELIGKKKGNEFNITTTFSDNYPSKELAGKKVNLKLTIKDIKRGNFPDLDDEFAKDMGFDNLEKLKGHIREEIMKLKRAEVAKIQKAEIINRLLETHDFELPESLLEEEIELLTYSLRSNQGDEADEEGIKKTREDVRPEAIKNLKMSLLLSMIGKKEGIHVSEDELKSAITAMARRFSVSPESIIKFYISRDGSLNRLKDAIFEDKVLDLLLSKATIEKGE